MFFHHGFFNPHHNWTRELEIGMQLLSAFITEEKLEESRERDVCPQDGRCDECERSSECHNDFRR